MVALAVPRIVRILYPQVWPEDDLYLESALAVTRGLRPYLDFSHPQMPLLEWAGAAYIQVAGASHAAMEALNAAAIYATSVLIFFLGRRAVGSQGATAGAILFSCSSLVFRYHVWAREFFVTALVLAAALVVLEDTMRARRQVGWTAALLAAACGIKLTTAVPAAAIVLFIALVQRRPLRAAAAALATGALALGLFAFCYWRYGFEFVFQGFIFHFVKGADGAGAGPAYPATILDVLVPLFLLGVARLAATRPADRALVMVLALLVPSYLFYSLLSPTAWGHNYLEPLPCIAIVAGAGAVWLLEAYRGSWLKLGGGLALVAASLIWIAPLSGENSSRGSVYGFGFIPREELAQLAAALRAATGPEDEVIAPSFIAFEANRIQRVRYPENYGVMRRAEAQYLARGLRATRGDFGRRSFFDLINETSADWNDQIITGVAIGGPINAVILDSPIQLLPLVNASSAALLDRGFRPVLTTQHYTFWLRSPS
jgi:4-amino-4-deoxy-L-arabinose transferase-like glycosyltransferase